MCQCSEPVVVLTPIVLYGLEAVSSPAVAFGQPAPATEAIGKDGLATRIGRCMGCAAAGLRRRVPRWGFKKFLHCVG